MDKEKDNEDHQRKLELRKKGSINQFSIYLTSTENGLIRLMDLLNKMVG
jgi:hypothetical protein